jgi:hypothetical protein
MNAMNNNMSPLYSHLPRTEDIPTTLPFSLIYPPVMIKKLWNKKDIVFIPLFSIFLCVISVASLMLVSRMFHHRSTKEVSITLSIIGCVIEFVALTGGIYVVGLRCKHLRWQDIGLRTLAKRWYPGVILLSLLVIPLGTLATVLVQAIARQPRTDPQLPVLLPHGLTWASAFVLVLLVGIVVPFAEELFFRGLLYKFIRERWGFWAATIISALVFGAAHLDLGIGASAFVLGLGCAFTYERSQSLWSAVILHAVSNTMKLLMIYLFMASSLHIPLF